jgi:hypothetical protein
VQIAAVEVPVTLPPAFEHTKLNSNKGKLVVLEKLVPGYLAHEDSKP